MKQKDIFLGGEGNAWFARNAAALAKDELPGSHQLLMDLLGLKSYLRDAGGPVECS